MIRVILVDDHQIVREGLKALLQNKPDFEVVAEAADGRAAVSLVEKVKPELVLMDIAMPGLNGIEACQQIKSLVPSCKILALSMHTDRRFVSRALQAGACGYLVKDCASQELVDAIYVVLQGRVYLSPSVAKTVVDDYLSTLEGKRIDSETALSAREREVLQLLAEGRCTREIASSLHVSVKTIETHRKQIMDKLNIHSIAELTKFAVREGLTQL